MSEISENTIFEHGGCFFFMLGLRSAVSEISENTIFDGGWFFLMLGLRSAVSEISGNTIFEHGGCSPNRFTCEGFLTPFKGVHARAG